MADVCYPRLQKAVRWASKLHKDQDQDGPSPLPYLAHPMEVLSNLRYVGGVTDEDLLCAAALHDTIEMSGVQAKKIEDRFGPRVRELVEELTRCEPAPEETAKMTAAEIWHLRSTMLLNEIKKMSPDAQTIKLADRLANVSFAPYEKSGAKLDRYLDQTNEILKIIPRKANPALWDAISGKLKSLLGPADKKPRTSRSEANRGRRTTGKARS